MMKNHPLKDRIMENRDFNERKYMRAKKKVKAIKGFYTHFMVYLAVNAFILLIQVFAGGGWGMLLEWHSYSTLVFWGIGVAFHAFGVFGMDFIFGTKWEDRKIKEIMDKDKHQFWE